ncbi:MAG: CoA synthetase [Xanthobacteraceae bacterium]|nr:CoA synthetase [Xanthobacteraceae bacterium]
MATFLTLDELAATIGDGMSLAIPNDQAGVAMAATLALTARASKNLPKNLHVICVPISGMQADILIGRGMVSAIETSAVTLGEAGGAPRFADGIRQRTFRMMDATCPALLAGFVAGQKGVPFMAIRGLIGSDLMAARPDWRIIDNPYADDDPVVVVPAIRPDVALFHAPEADRFGNVRIGRHAELAAMAHAARRTLVTVERISDTSLLANENEAAGVLPALYVSAIAEVPRGAWPLGLWGEYALDGDEVARYAQLAQTPEGFAAYLEGAMRRREIAA